MAAIKVTSEQVESVSKQLQGGSEEVSQKLAQMEGQVKGLVDAEWQGAASDSFREMYEKWQRGARDVKEALDGISTMLGQAAKTYQETEDQLASQMRG